MISNNLGYYIFLTSNITSFKIYNILANLWITDDVWFVIWRIEDVSWTNKSVHLEKNNMEII